MTLRRLLSVTELQCHSRYAAASCTSTWTDISQLWSQLRHIAYFQVLFLVPCGCACMKLLLLSSIFQICASLNVHATQILFDETVAHSLTGLATILFFFLQRQLFLTQLGLESLLPSKISQWSASSSFVNWRLWCCYSQWWGEQMVIFRHHRQASASLLRPHRRASPTVNELSILFFIIYSF